MVEDVDPSPRTGVAIHHGQPEHAEAAGLAVDAHQALLDAGGEQNFWESGWLHHQLERLRQVAKR